MRMIGNFFAHNGDFLPVSEARISLDDINFTYGYGVYETLKARKGLVYFPLDHIERLFHSAQIIGIEVGFKKSEIVSWVLELVKKNGLEDCNIKILCIGAANDKGPDIYILCLNPLFPPRRLYRDGASLLTMEGERHFPQAKSLSMLMSAMAYRKAIAAGCYDALLINRQGQVTEGTRTNLFYLQNNMVFTPPAEQSLEGVTKHTLVSCLKNNNIEIKERTLPIGELKSVQGLFLTSTSSKVMPVSRIDENEIQIPELIREIIKMYNEYLEDYRNSTLSFRR